MRSTNGLARFTKIALFLVLCAAGSGCEDTEIQSTWLADEISIDGSSIDWDGYLLPVADDKALVGVRNDDTHLYVCLVVTPRELQIPVLLGGLTLWFEVGDEEKRGFRYPVAHGGVPVAPPTRDARPEELWDRIDDSSEIEVLAFQGELNRFVEPNSEFDTAVGEQYGALVYEAKIPIHSEDDSPFSIHVDALSPLRVGIETTQPERPEGGRGKGRPGGGGRGGGRGGGPGGGRGGGGRSGGEPGADRPAMPEAIEVWTGLHLAEGPE